MMKSDSGRVPSAPGSHPSGHAAFGVDGASRFDPSRGEKVCMDCGGHNPVWFAPNPLWNLVIGGPEARGDPGGFYCPNCFILRAEAAGVVPTAWMLIPETEATGRICCPTNALADRVPEASADLRDSDGGPRRNAARCGARQRGSEGHRPNTIGTPPMTGQYTKGPWRAGGWVIEAYTDGEPGIVVRETIAFVDRGEDLAHREANARLIAAAPDLLEALEGIKWRSDDKDNMEFAARITCFQMDKIRAALLRARAK